MACEGRGRMHVRYEEDGSRTVLADRFEGNGLKPTKTSWSTGGDASGSRTPIDEVLGDRCNMELDHDSVYRSIPNGMAPSR